MNEPDATNRSAPDAPSEGMPELTEAEREALEQQMREIRVEDLLVQTVVSVLNLSARRIVKEDERDLAEARLGIDSVRALVGLLPEEAAAAVREPLSQIQLLYAQHGGGPGRGDGGGADQGTQSSGTRGTSGLWVPGQ